MIIGPLRSSKLARYVVAGMSMLSVLMVAFTVAAGTRSDPVDIVMASDFASEGASSAAAPSPEPTPTPPAAGGQAPADGVADGVAETPVLRVEGADEELVDTGPLSEDPLAATDYVPSFVPSDLTVYGTHVSVEEPPPVEAVPQPAASVRTRTPRPEPEPEPEPITTPEPLEPVVETDTPVEESAPGPDETPETSPESEGADDGSPTSRDWARLRHCESGGSYTISTGNGYYGAYQFSQATWDHLAAVSRPRLVGVVPSDAAPAAQDALAIQLYDLRGSGPWPSCGRFLD